MTLCLALSYGGRESIVAAARALCEAVAAGELEPEDITEERFAAALQTARPAAARPADPHLGRGAAVELPALGSGLRRALLHRHVLARLRQGRAVRGARVVPAPRAPLRPHPRADPQRRLRAPAWRCANLAQRLISAVVALPLVGALILWQPAAGVRRAGAGGGGAGAARVRRDHAGRRGPRALRVGVIAIGVGAGAGLYVAPGHALVWVLAAFVGDRGARCCSIPATSRPRARGWGSRRSASSTWALLPAPLALMQRDARRTGGPGCCSRSR